MKKSILILCFLLLCGCSQPKVERDDFTYILFATPLKEHMIWLKAKEGFDVACSENEVKCDWIGPSVIDTQVMNNVIETGILQGADAIITQGVIDPALINEAKAEGIPILLVDSDISDSSRLAYMGKDFHEQAELLLAEIEQKYEKNKKLNIAIQVAEKNFQIAQNQIKEVEKVFSKHSGGFEIVSISESKSDQVRAKKEWERVFNKYPDINVAINFAAESAELCADIAVNKNRRDKMLIYGVDDMDSTLDLIINDKIDGTVVTSFYDYGYKGVTMLLDYLNHKKEPTQKQYFPSLMIVNKENVKIYETSK